MVMNVHGPWLKVKAKNWLSANNITQDSFVFTSPTWWYEDFQMRSISGWRCGLQLYYSSPDSEPEVKQELSPCWGSVCRGVCKSSLPRGRLCSVIIDLSLLMSSSQHRIFFIGLSSSCTWWSPIVRQNGFIRTFHAFSCVEYLSDAINQTRFVALNNDWRIKYNKMRKFEQTSVCLFFLNKRCYSFSFLFDC